MWEYVNYSELYHYGVKGMRWGHRKNPLQFGFAGAKRRQTSEYSNMLNSRDSYAQARQQAKAQQKAAKNAYKEAKKAERNTPEAKAERKARAKVAISVGAAVAATALAAYGAHKLNKFVKDKNATIAAKKGYETAEKLFANKVEMFKSSPSNNYGSNIKRSYTELHANSGARATEARIKAQKDNFFKALGNVAKYKRENGSLKSLGSASDWERKRGSVWRDITEWN